MGKRFAIMLPADPAHGWRWVVEPVDTTFLAPLGSEFRDDPTLLAQSTTTTTAPPPPETTTTLFTGRTTTTTEPTPTTEGPTTTTTAPGPLVQIVSYAGRNPGVTTVTLRYERIGTAEQPSEATQTVVFTVLIGTPPGRPATERTGLRRDCRLKPPGRGRHPDSPRSRSRSSWSSKPGATPSSNSRGRMARSMASQMVRDHGKNANGTATAATAADTEMSTIGGSGHVKPPRAGGSAPPRSGPGRC